MSAYDILISLPFEVRAKIWGDAMPTVAQTINCCSCTSIPHDSKHHLPCQVSSAPRSAARKCILPFSTIVAIPDPFAVAVHDPKLKAPTTFVFCSALCLSTAMRLSTPALRVLLQGSTIRVNMPAGDVAWVLEGGDLPMSIMESGPLRKWVHMEECEANGELDGEARIDVLRGQMIRKLVRLVKRYFGSSGEKGMRFMWSGRNGGLGWVEMDA